MQFLIIGKGGKDEKAGKRRLAVREAHLKLGDQMEGRLDSVGMDVLLDDNNKMIGSMAVSDFTLRKRIS